VEWFGEAAGNGWGSGVPAHFTPARQLAITKPGSKPAGFIVFARVADEFHR